MENRIYQDDAQCLFVATSIAEAADIACCEESEITKWTDAQMQGQVMSDADMKKYGVLPQTWLELASFEQVGFLLDLSEPCYVGEL